MYFQKQNKQFCTIGTIFVICTIIIFTGLSLFLCITCITPCLANLTYFHVHLPTQFCTWASLWTVDDINISRSTSSYPHLHTSSYPCCLLSGPRWLPVISSCQICSRRAPWLTDIYLFVFFIDGWILLLTHPRKCRNLTSRYNLVRPKVYKLLSLCKVGVVRAQPGHSSYLWA